MSCYRKSKSHPALKWPSDSGGLGVVEDLLSALPTMHQMAGIQYWLTEVQLPESTSGRTSKQPSNLSTCWLRRRGPRDELPGADLAMRRGSLSELNALLAVSSDKDTADCRLNFDARIASEHDGGVPRARTAKQLLLEPQRSLCPLARALRNENVSRPCSHRGRG